MAMTVAILGLLCAGCGGGVDSYEDGMEAQADVMEEIVEILEGVDDEASAGEAASEIEALGERLAEIDSQMQKLPPPTMDEMQEFAREHGKRRHELQQKASAQLAKLGEYEALRRAFSRAMASTVSPRNSWWSRLTGAMTQTAGARRATLVASSRPPMPTSSSV